MAHLKHKQSSPKRTQQHSQDRQDSLAARLMAGEQAAATELVDRYYQQIYLYMRGLGHDRQFSEDLTQETFFRAWHHIGQLRDGKALNAWLYRIAGNVSKLYWRKNKGRETASIEKIDVPDGSKAQHDKIEYYEQLGQLKNAIERLPWKLKQTIVLHYLQHLSIAQAAEAAGVREGTFKSRLNRALRILRKHVI
ncbi:MAG: RNA polymerase sigma factor [Sedimentisphaerales bacterium]